MKTTLILTILAMTMLWTQPALTQGLVGSYVLSQPDVTLTLNLDQGLYGSLHGTLVSTSGARYFLEGIIKDGIGIGTISSEQGGMYFKIHPQGSQLFLALIEADAMGNPDYNRAKKLMFVRKGGSDIPNNIPRAELAPQRPTAHMSDLMNHFAKTWIYMSDRGATIEKYTLLPDGTYYHSGETSYYSGQYGHSSPDSNWGAVGTRQNQGRWSIQGTKDQGQIFMTFPDGSQQVIPYQVHKRDGVAYYGSYYFDGVYYFSQEAWEESKGMKFPW